LNKVNWSYLLHNPAIFGLYRDAMRKQIEDFAKELLEKALHPKHFERNLLQYGYDICLNEYVE